MTIRIQVHPTRDRTDARPDPEEWSRRFPRDDKGEPLTFCGRGPVGELEDILCDDPGIVGSIFRDLVRRWEERRS